MATEKPRYTITVDDDLLESIEDFRVEMRDGGRIPSRTEATVTLIELGLQYLKLISETDD